MSATVLKKPAEFNHHEFIPPATQLIHIDDAFTMKRGGTLPSFTLGYETWGTLNNDKSNVILLFTGLSPSAHAAANKEDPRAGWWEPMIGKGKAIDTERYFVICFNALGSCYGSTGPASINPETGEAWRLDFPELSVEDIARSIWRGLQTLGIQQLDTVIGASMGGMTALAFSLLFPKATRHLIAISTAMHSLPFAIAIRSLQREMICRDPDWMQGEYPFDQETLCGMRMARKLGMASYRSANEWETRFGRQRVPEKQQQENATPFTSEFQIESYLEHHANKFTGHFDANSYLYLSRAVDWFDVLEYGETAQAAFNALSLEKATIVGIETDILFPIHQQAEIADALTANGVSTDYHALPCIQGHDAFLVDYDRFVPLIKTALE
jgi:homoserine O-acetyltransferase